MADTQSSFDCHRVLRLAPEVAEIATLPPGLPERPQGRAFGTRVAVSLEDTRGRLRTRTGAVLVEIGNGDRILILNGSGLHTDKGADILMRRADGTHLEYWAGMMMPFSRTTGSISGKTFGDWFRTWSHVDRFRPLFKDKHNVIDLWRTGRWAERWVDDTLKDLNQLALHSGHHHDAASAHESAVRGPLTEALQRHVDLALRILEVGDYSLADTLAPSAGWRQRRSLEKEAAREAAQRAQRPAFIPNCLTVGDLLALVPMLKGLHPNTPVVAEDGADGIQRLPRHAARLALPDGVALRLSTVEPERIRGAAVEEPVALEDDADRADAG